MQLKINSLSTKSILTKSNLPVSDYSVNTYVGCPHACMYCYACFMKRFTGHSEPWGSFTDVKYWPRITNPKRYEGKSAFIGSVTDPYNPLEAQYKRTRAFLEELQGSGISISIATKSDLVLRDLELIKTFPNAKVAWSINTLDENFRNDMDQAVSIARRLQAMKIFYDAGVATTCFISPIFPEITDVPAIIRRVKEQCNFIWLENLNLRADYKSKVLNYLSERYPALLPLYNEIYFKNDKSYWLSLDCQLRTLAESLNLEYKVDEDILTRPHTAAPVIVNFFYHELIKKSARYCKRT